MSRKKKKQTKAGTNRGGSQRNPTPKNVSDFGSKLQNALATARSNNELPTESSKTGKTKQPPVKPDTGRVKSLTRRPSVEIGLSKTNSVGEADRTTKGRFTKQAYLQFHNGEPQEEREIVIGLDFGTSSTKICFRDVQRNQSFLIDFGDYSHFDSATYLLQSTLYYRTGQQVFSLTKGDHKLNELKIQLMESPTVSCIELADGTSLSSEEVVSTYLGLALKLARWRFKQLFGAQYAKVEILWQLNLGIPSRSYDDVELVASYHKIGMAAWDLSLESEFIDAEKMKSVWESVTRTLEESVEVSADSLHPDQVVPIPEVVAGAVGYANSSIKRDNFMHLLIDIGASTVDIATLFLSSRAGVDRYSFLTAEVAALGGYQLTNHRLMSFAGALQEKLQLLLDSADTMTPPPTPESIQLSVDKEEVDEPFLHEYRKLVGDSLLEVKKTRYPLVVNQDQIPVLFSGGGTQISVYHDALEKLNLKPYSIPELNQLNFDIFDDLEKIGDVDLSRIGVAYGLSFSPDDIGPILAPNAVPSLAVDGESAHTQPVSMSEKLAYQGPSIRFDR